MNRIVTAALMTRETLMFLPLIVFCFLPVMPKVKSRPIILLGRILLAVIGMETAFFIIYLISPTSEALIFSMLFCVTGFFYLYQREVDIKCSHLWFLFMTACMIGSFGYVCHFIIDALFNPKGTISLHDSLHVLLLELFVECIIIALIWMPSKKYLGWLVVNFQEEKVWRVVWIFPLTLTVFFYFFVPYYNSTLYINRLMEMYLLVLAVLLTAIFLLYVLFYRVAYSMVENQKIAERTIYLEMQAAQYRNLQEHIQETNRIRHDFRHQLTALGEMLYHEQYDEAKKFLKENNLEFSKTAKQFCESPAVNAILNHYEALCREHGITTHFNFQIPYETTLSDMDLCVLLGNLLENALHGCQETTGIPKVIELKAGQTAPHLIAMQIRNSYTGTLKMHKGQYLSSKHEGEGQGLKSVHLISEKYNGTMKIELKNQQFVVRILIKV